MNEIEENLPLLRQMMNLLGKHYGNTSEIVIHDLTQDYTSTIVDIVNGHITNRETGGCGSNLGLEVLRGTVESGDRFNYITTTQSGKILRSSSIYIKDKDDKIVGSVCINTDITTTLQLESYLKQINQFDRLETEEEVFASDVNSLLTHLIQMAQEQIGKSPNEMNKSEKIEFIRYLDKKGAFLITKSGEQIREFLNISKFTFYNYLELSREEAK